ncbi:MAG: cbb3-type cytochrome c oxidase subunit I [Parachlamydiales bacterium]
MYGRLTLKAFEHDLLQSTVAISVVLGALFLGGLITYLHRWRWLWKNWLTTVDPKKIGVMYLIVALIMLLKGISDAVLIRAQQFLAVGEASGLLSADHFQQIFTAHGTTMIFFVGMGFVFGLMNLIIPLQIGARDVAFPFLNAVSFWLFASGASLLMVSLVYGVFSATGWVAYPPLSEAGYNPGVGVDYWIWSVQVAGVGSLLSGINFMATIFMMRCPGMTLMRMPMFVWASIGTLVLVLFAFPVLTATISMLALDRTLGMHLFTSQYGGNPMMYINLIWAWGHPEVYILILPAFGVYSEVVATFSRKRLFGYASMVWAIVAITVLSFIVWLHHFFTMGAGPNVNAFFGLMTMIIAVPTGVKIFNWLFTMFRGRVEYKTPLLWFLGFVFTFTTGGVSGVLLSIAPFDFQTHNSLFLIAHFHSMVIGGVLFGLFAAITYWFPKVFGFTLNERIGRWAFYLWLVGFVCAFFPLYALGFMGATRRLNQYGAELGWHPLFTIAAFGVALVCCGVALQILQIIQSIRHRQENRDTTGDPWNGRTLEWSTRSPPPLYNFATLPEVHTRDPFWEMKQHGHHPPSRKEEILLPKNSALTIWIGGLSLVASFAMVWHLFWLFGLGLAGIIACLITRLYTKETETPMTVGG